MKSCVLVCALGWMAAGLLLGDEATKPKLVLTIESMSPDGIIKVDLHNQSIDEIRVWTGPFSWAWDNWKVIVLRHGQTRLYAPNPNEMFTVNFPANAPINPGAIYSVSLNIGSEDWIGPKDIKPLLQIGDKIVVLYDVRWSKEVDQYHVWTGLLATSADYNAK